MYSTQFGTLTLVDADHTEAKQEYPEQVFGEEDVGIKKETSLKEAEKKCRVRSGRCTYTHIILSVYLCNKKHAWRMPANAKENGWF